MFLNYFDAHTPFLSPDGPDPRFGTAGLSYAERDRILRREQRLLQNPTSTTGLDVQNAIRAATEVRRDSYESCIASLDRQIGLLFDELEASDLARIRCSCSPPITANISTNAAFTATDHLKPETHIPLLVLPPTSESGVAKLSVDTPVSLRDVAATVVDLLDCADREPFPGQSLARFWRPGNNSEHFPLLAELGRRDGLQPNPRIPTSLGTLKALVDRDLLYLRNGDGREELYNLAADPQETRNLAADPAARRSRG